MKRIKVISLVMAVMFVLTVFAGCGASNKPAETTAAPAATNATTQSDAETTPAQLAPATISFWHTYTDGVMKEVMDKQLNEFRAAYPMITLNDLGTTFWDYWAKLSTAMASGAGPDVEINDNATIPERARPKLTLPLDEYVARDGVNMNDYFQVLVDNSTYEGKLYAMPFDTAARVLFYNKDHFSEAGLDPNAPPKNFAELEDYAKQLIKWNGKDNKIIDRVGFEPTLGNVFFWVYAWTNGGVFFDEAGNPTANTPENIEALEWMQRVHNINGSKALASFSAVNGATGYSPFIDGKISMVIDVNSLYGDIKKHNPGLNYGVSVIPYNKKNITWAGGMVLELVDNKDKAKADAGWELIKFLTSKEKQLEWCTQTGDLVANSKAALDETLTADAKWKFMMEQMPTARFCDYIPGNVYWFGDVSNEVVAVMDGAKTPKQALDDAQKVISDKIANYNATK